MLTGVKRTAKGEREKGFTLLEIAMAISLLGTAILAAALQVATDAQVVQMNRETTLAMNVAREMVDRVKNHQNLNTATYRDIFAAFNETTIDDPVVAPGAHVAAQGLHVQAGDADGMVARVRFPVDPNNPAVLREDIDDSVLGMPMDLNGDGLIDANDHSGDYVVLPFSVVVEWRTMRGANRSLELSAVVIRPKL